METIKLQFHSVVDVITNSSTVIYTYQDGSIEPAKELINEMLKLQGIEDKTADDLFYFGIFVDEDHYIEQAPDSDDLTKGLPEIVGKYGTEEYNVSCQKREEALEKLTLQVLKGEITKPKWMEEAEENDDIWNPDSYLTLLPKNEKYAELGKKISALLNSITADGGRDG